MSLSPSTLPRSAHLVHVHVPAQRQGRGDGDTRERLIRLAAAHDSDSARAAVLAFMLNPSSRRERAAWAEATAGTRDAERCLDDMRALPHAHQLPWFEHFARALAHGPVTLRHDVIDAARRVMIADRMVTTMDQLRWVALRHLLAGSAVSPPAAAATELDTLNDLQAAKACVFSAFLSQLVPAPELTLDLSGDGSLSQVWYDTVTAPWSARPRGAPERQGHDIDASLRALRTLQALPWLLRPVLVRRWFDAARSLTDGPALHPAAADALRLACVLLDSPVPPELGRQYIEVEAARA
ncbi:MAG TPA: hypothetical protein VFQ20_15135 [Burkholderiaceae bacterium]|nr:hypothetical protein [Burkholderiaceae bacterium]